MPNRKLDQELRKQHRAREREARRSESPETKRARPEVKEDEDQLPELSERGGIEPTERSPSEYHDRTRDRTLDEG